MQKNNNSPEQAIHLKLRLKKYDEGRMNFANQRTAIQRRTVVPYYPNILLSYYLKKSLLKDAILSLSKNWPAMKSRHCYY